MIDWGEVKGVVIGTPFYEVKGYAPYIRSLVFTINAFNFFKVPWEYRDVWGDSYVDRAKNSIVHDFLKNEKHSHLLMIDSDESWDVHGVMRIIKAAKYGAEVVGAAYPCKNNWEFYGCVPKIDEDGSFVGKEVDVPGGLRLLSMEAMPGGFICYSRKAFERARPLLNSYHAPETGEEILEAFKCNVEEHGGRIGEDVYFQQRYMEAGGTVWCEPNVNIQHWGVKAWEGNYQDYLIEEKRKQAQEVELGESQSKTKELLSELENEDSVNI